MSNNAVEAYNHGEMPMSKWTKQAILEAAADLVDDEEITAEEFEALKAYKAADLKKNVLEQTSWHHTSKMYNKTYFYSVSADLIREFVDPERERFVERIQATTPDGVKLGHWTDVNPNGFGYLTFTADDGCRYPQNVVKNCHFVKVKEEK